MEIEKVDGSNVRASLFMSVPVSVEEYSIVGSGEGFLSYCNEIKDYVNVKRYNRKTEDGDISGYCHMDIQYGRKLLHFKVLSRASGGLECEDSTNRHDIEVLFSMEM